MNEPTAKRIAKSLELLAGQTSNNNAFPLEDIALCLSLKFSKLSTVKILKCIADLNIKEAKDIADKYYK